MISEFQQHISKLKKEVDSLVEGDKRRYRLNAELKGFEDCLKLVRREIEKLRNQTGYRNNKRVEDNQFIYSLNDLNELLKALGVENE